MLTNGQKQALHKAARLMDMTAKWMGGRFTEEMRRTVQWNVGGFHSAADTTASRQGFIAVMAFYEGELAKFQVQLARTPTYWRDELDRAPTSGLLYRLRSLARQLDWPDMKLAAWMGGERMMNTGSPVAPEEANAYWLGRAVNGLQAILKRRSDRSV